MSLVEKIKETENKAEQIKFAAENEVNKILEKTNIDNKLQVQQMMNQLAEDVKELNKQTIEKLNHMEQLKKEECTTINQKNEELAKIHLDETIDYLLKKVMDL